MKKILLLLLPLLLISCSQDSTDNGLSYKSYTYYTINDNEREDYNPTKPIDIVFKENAVILTDTGIKSTYNITKIENNIYYVWINVKIEDDNGNPPYYIKTNFTIEIQDTEIIFKDNDHDITHGSYFEIHYII